MSKAVRSYRFWLFALPILTLFIIAATPKFSPDRPHATTERPSASVTQKSFESSIHPLLSEYCLKCHSTEKHKGDLDLEQFTSLDQIKRHPDVWEKVIE